MHIRYMDGFEGILVADRYSACRAGFEEVGRLQLCRAHEIYNIAEAALRPGSTPAASACTGTQGACSAWPRT